MGAVWPQPRRPLWGKGRVMDYPRSNAAALCPVAARRRSFRPAGLSCVAATPALYHGSLPPGRPGKPAGQSRPLSAGTVPVSAESLPRRGPPLQLTAGRGWLVEIGDRGGGVLLSLSHAALMGLS